MGNGLVKIDRQNILGVNVSIVHMEKVLRAIEKYIAAKQQRYICVTPLHSIMDCYDRPELIPIFNNSGITTPDGMGVVFAMRILGHRTVDRVYGPDLMEAVCQLSTEKGYTHYFYGGAPGIPEQLAKVLRSRFGELDVRGTYSPPYRPLTETEDIEIIEKINQANPDVLWIGISSPKQEQWMADHLGKINAPVMIGVGAAFDFLSGNKRQAPRFIQRSGLEWIYRLVQEPRRLWGRYCKYPRFGLLFVHQLLKG